MYDPRDEKLSCLVVDDEKEICDLVEGFLKETNWFYSIVKAYDPSQALQKIANQDFDLIVTDNKMPKKEGLDFIKLVRSTERRKQPEVILMSSYLKTRHVNKALSTGVKNILVKPFTSEQLLGMIRKIFGVTEDGKIIKKK